MTLSTTNYRVDINGLRAWAVVAVILYHFQVPGFGAGFIGVDLFFVISGYLMTAIVLKGLQDNSLSLSAFYLARLRRIGPALWAMLLILLALGWFWLPTTNYQELGHETGYALGFFSNVLFWKTAGYFDTASHDKWLLHTWTLGVEFQFYVLYPLVLIAIWKIQANIKTLFYTVAVLCLCSFLLSVWSSFWPSATGFYLLPFRAWEFLAGGLIVLSASWRPALKINTKYLLWGSLGLWVLALTLIESQWAWPAGWAALPVLSAVGIIFAQQNQSILTAHPVMQWLGDRSYSLYLWHWPVMVALYYLDIQNEPLWITVGIGISLLFGDLSYRYIETPTRQGLVRYLTPPQQSILLLSSAAVVACTALGVQWFQFTNRPTAPAELVASAAHDRNPRWTECLEAATPDGSPGCIFGDEREIGAILLGDSHAAALATAAGTAAQEHHQGVIFWGLSACITLDNVKYPSYTPFSKNRCLRFNQWVNKQLEQYPNVPVIVASRTSDYLSGPNEPDRTDEIDQLTIYFSKEYRSRLEPAFQEEFRQVFIDTSCRLAKQRPVYLVRPVPEHGLSVPTTLSKNLIFNKQAGDIKMPRHDYDVRHRLVWEAQDQTALQCENIHILDPTAYLCDEAYCYGSKHGRPLYFDDDHLSEHGNSYLTPMFKAVFSP